jgi:pyridoxamine 5'-phosphate oxidase
MVEYKISSIRKDFSKRKLKPELLDDNPIHQFQIWLQEAIKAEVPDPTAMCLATVDADGQPSTRMLLLKDVINEKFIFYTNYRSQKSKEIDHNPKCSMNFFWPELERQINIMGTVQRIDPKISDDYFRTRPYKSQVGAWASPQSEPISSRNFIKLEFAKYAARFMGREVPRPPHWGGFSLEPYMISFWQGRPNRLHDRVKYTLMESGKWEKVRIAP